MGKHSRMDQFLFFFVKRLRLSSPWKFKVPILISVPYYVFLLSNYNGYSSFAFVLASLVIIIGVAAIGYLTNDLGDREKDKLINKDNSTTYLSSISVVLLIIFFLGLVIMPWYFLKFNRVSIVLLVFQLFLFYAYAFKPFRLKEKGFFGIITDSFYAHVLPAILASYTFCLVVIFDLKKYIPFIVLLGTWQLMLGVRNILFHQLKDFDNDINSKTYTFVTQYGFYRTETFIKKIILPLEIVFFIIFVVYVSFYYPLFFLFLFMYWVYKLYSEKHNLKNFNYRDFSYKFLDDLYIQWVPLCVLILLCINSAMYIPILVLHVLLFRSEAKTFLINKFNL